MGCKVGYSAVDRQQQESHCIDLLLGPTCVIVEPTNPTDVSAVSRGLKKIKMLTILESASAGGGSRSTQADRS